MNSHDAVSCDQLSHCINLAARHYIQSDYPTAFRIIIDALREDTFHLKAQTIAVASLTKINVGVLDHFIAAWVAVCRFGTLENATVILAEVFVECDNTYDLFAGLAILSLRKGQPELSLRLFGLCLTADLPIPVAVDEIQHEYDADLYDRQGPHLDSIAEFKLFLDRHLGREGDLEIIDAPCGTGLAGPILKPWARRLVGLDLVSAMVSRAESLGCYDELIVGDLLKVLPRLKAEMIVCHGALYYFRDLAPIVAAVANSLEPGGRFAFTDFPAPEGIMATRGGNARFCRSPALVRNILTSHGFIEEASEMRLSFTLPCLYWMFRKR